MESWQYLCLKAVVLLAAMLAMLGVLAVALLLLMANGSAISPSDFSLRAFIFSCAIFISQMWLTVLGVKAAWQGVDRWSESLWADRSEADQS